MLVYANARFLLASPDPTVLAGLEPLLLSAGAGVEIVLSAEAALAALTSPTPPTLALVDANLPGMDPRMTVEVLLAEGRPGPQSERLPIVVIADAVTEEWMECLANGVIDDVILRSTEFPYWRLRLEKVLRTLHKMRELEALREAIRVNAQMDRLTGVYNRETMMAMLFRETDRVQRMKGSLAMILFDVDDFGHWNSRLGSEACDDLLCQVVGRTTRLLRSYDLLGRPGLDEFLIALPGCTTENARTMAERIQREVFSVPFHAGGDAIRLSACFGIAASHGRSPVVVLREAEQALLLARDEGPESMECFGESCESEDFFSPSAKDERLAS